MSVPGDMLYKPGHKWQSGIFELCFSLAGNLELRDTHSRRLIWHSGTSGGIKLAMQKDGNLVIYSAADAPLWASNTHDNRDAVLRFDPDGNLAIYSTAGKQLWSASGNT